MANKHRAAAATARAIHLAIQEGAFRARDVRRGLSDPPSESTLTRILQQLEADGWLYRRWARSDIWRAGFKARAHGDMTESALTTADRDATQPGEDVDRKSELDLSW